MIGAEFVGFDYSGPSLLKEIKKNIETLFSTPEGSIPGERGLGMSRDYLDAPRPVAENLLAVDIYTKVETFEPRATVLDIRFDTGEDGQILATVRIGPNEFYEEEEGEGGA